MQATIDLTTTCLTYLCLDPFNPEIEEEYLTENIISGGYRLHAYAASQWVGLVRKCAGMHRNRTPPDELIALLEIFISERENMGYKGSSECTPEYGELELFKKEWPNLHTMLCRALKFRQLDVGDWRLDEGMHDLYIGATRAVIYSELTKAPETQTIHGRIRTHLLCHTLQYVSTNS